MVGTQEFSFKVSPVWRETLRLDADGFSFTLRGKERRRIAFVDVSDVSVYRHATHGAEIETVRFADGRGEITVWSLATVGAENMATFRRAVAALLRAYATSRPGAEVHLGRVGAARWKSAALLLAVLLGAWLWVALPDGRVDPMEYALLPIMLIAAGFVSNRYLNLLKPPGRQLAEQAADEFAHLAATG